MSGLRINSRRLRAWRRRINVRLPNGEVYALDEGPATSLTKAVLEVFAHKFLRMPAAVRVVQRGTPNKLYGTDHTLALHFPATAARDLPEVVLADVSPEQFRLVFVAVVPDSAKRGAFDATRKQALVQRSREAGLSAADICLVSCFSSRTAGAFRQAVAHIPWGTFAWFSSEPEALLAFHECRDAVFPSPPSSAGSQRCMPGG